MAETALKTKRTFGQNRYSLVCLHAFTSAAFSAAIICFLWPNIPAASRSQVPPEPGRNAFTEYTAYTSACYVSLMLDHPSVTAAAVPHLRVLRVIHNLEIDHFQP